MISKWKNAYSKHKFLVIVSIVSVCLLLTFMIGAVYYTLLAKYGVKVPIMPVLPNPVYFPIVK